MGISTGLAFPVLQQVGVGALERTRGLAGEGGRMPAGLHPAAGSLEPDQSDRRVVEEGVEDADRVGSFADAGRHHVVAGPA